MVPSLSDTSQEEIKDKAAEPIACRGNTCSALLVKNA